MVKKQFNYILLLMSVILCVLCLGYKAYAEDGSEDGAYSITYELCGGENSRYNPATYDTQRGVRHFENAVKYVNLGYPYHIEPWYAPHYEFEGWYEDKQYTKPIESIPAGTTGDITLYAKWKPAQRTITYKLNGGSLTDEAPVSYDCEDGDVYLPVPYYYGHTFKGWNIVKMRSPVLSTIGVGNLYYIMSNIEGYTDNIPYGTVDNVEFEAIWEPSTTYIISYYLDGGRNSANNPATYTIDDEIILAKPSKTGYVFDGWHKGFADGERVDKISVGTEGNFVLYARWKVTHYNIRFVGNNASDGSMGNIDNCTYDRNLTLPANKYTKKGYTFTGWNTKADGSGISYANNATVSRLTAGGGTVTLYAQWKLTSYRITYNTNGGTNSRSNPATYTIYDTVNFANPARKGYVFAGWYTDSAFKNRITTINKGTRWAKTLYAKWQVVRYNVHFSGNGSTAGTMTDLKNYTYTRKFNLPDNKFTRKGYTFAGWNTKADGKGTKYANKAEVSGISLKNGTVTLYAMWNPVKYKITYNLNGGTNNSANPSYYTTGAGLTYKNPSKKGYTFAGWYADKNFKTKVTVIPKGSTGVRTVYAKWNINHYTISFNGNGSTSGSTKQMSCTYGKSYNLTASGFARKGYWFAGWNTKADGSGAAFANKASVKSISSINNKNVILYAQWKPLKYTITYNTDGGTIAKNAPASYTTGSEIVLPAITKNGFAFEGWYTSKSFAARVTKIPATSTGNKTFFAKWRQLIEVTCSKCHGYGKVLCSHCGGVGSNRCVTCGGKGYSTNYILNVTINCSACYGTGQKRCIWCQGTGRDTCYTCSGKGFVLK